MVVFSEQNAHYIIKREKTRAKQIQMHEKQNQIKEQKIYLEVNFGHDNSVLYNRVNSS